MCTYNPAYKLARKLRFKESDDDLAHDGSGGE